MTTPSVPESNRRAYVHNAITEGLSKAGDWVPLGVRVAATRAALAEVDAWHAAGEQPDAPSVPADVDLRDRIEKAIAGVLPMTSGMARAVVADAVLAVLPAPRRPFDEQAGLGRLAGHLARGETAVGPAVPADTEHHEYLRKIANRLAAHATGFQDVLDESDRGPWGRTVAADIEELRAVLSALPPPVDRACGPDVVGAIVCALQERAQEWHQAAAFAQRAADKARRKADEAQQAERTPEQRILGEEVPRA